ncbi:S1 family peptidase [Burkholderia plantarii]|uniref:S1 family peptidase n=1 Tax=Burkholderia plantarii TaxID=41899 RepID=UPI0009F4106C|nr:serine protease [Burkholderia plantarii]
MPPSDAFGIYKKFSGSIVYVSVAQPDGTEGIGSAFHVGEGVFVTARHVVENNEILEVGRHDIGEKFEIIAGPFLHKNITIDVAVFRVNSMGQCMPAIPLGGHLDDYLGYDDFVLAEIVVLGYPPIPFASRPQLIAARGEVNSLISLRNFKHAHFIISTMARGGFSGGPVVHEGGQLLGIVTQSLVMNGQPEQIGYMTVLSVEPIYECLAAHKLLPAQQAEEWEDFWNTEFEYFYRKATSETSLDFASVALIDDGRKIVLEILIEGPEYAEALSIVNGALSGFAFDIRLEDKKSIIAVSPSAGASKRAAIAYKMVCEALMANGYTTNQSETLTDFECPF